VRPKKMQATYIIDHKRRYNEQVAQSCFVTLRHFAFGILEVRVVARG